MRILFACTQTEPGGAQTASIQLARYMQSQGHEVKVLFLFRRRDLNLEGLDSDVLFDARPSGVLGLMKCMTALLQSVKAYAPDCMFGMSRSATPLALFVGSVTGVKRRIATHRNPLSSYSKAMRWITLWWTRMGVYTESICVSKSVREDFVRYGIGARSDFRTVLNGTSFVVSSLNSRQARSKIECDQTGERILLTVGRLSPEKNHGFLLRVISGIPNARLLIVGDGQLRSQLEGMARDLGVQHQVDFVGEVTQEQLSIYFRSADLFLFPSTYEAFGFVQVEAMLSECLVLASNIDASKEVGGGYTMIVDLDEETWRSQIQSMLNMSELQRDERTLAALEYARSNFGLPRMAREYLENPK